MAWITTPPNAVVIALASLPAIPALAIRRRYPVGVMVFLASQAVVLTLFIGTRPLLTLAVAIYTVASERIRLSLLALAAALFANAFAVAYEIYSLIHSYNVVLIASLIYAVFIACDLVAWALGRLIARSRSREKSLEALRDEMAAAAIQERTKAARSPVGSEGSRIFVCYRSDDTGRAPHQQMNLRDNLAMTVCFTTSFRSLREAIS